MDEKTAVVSLIFRGKDADKNANAFMLYMDSLHGIVHTTDGIHHFGGCITCIVDDPEQLSVVLDGDVEYEAEIDDENDGFGGNEITGSM